jgi:hypothetical protein
VITGAGIKILPESPSLRRMQAYAREREQTPAAFADLYGGWYLSAEEFYVDCYAARYARVIRGPFAGTVVGPFYGHNAYEAFFGLIEERSGMPYDVFEPLPWNDPAVAAACEPWSLLEEL